MMKKKVVKKIAEQDYKVKRDKETKSNKKAMEKDLESDMRRIKALNRETKFKKKACK